MGRLIEENSVIEVAEKFTFTDENERRKYLDFVRYCVQNSKTAYDVEKVEIGIRHWIGKGYRDIDGDYVPPMIETDTVIGLVRKGGIDG